MKLEDLGAVKPVAIILATVFALSACDTIGGMGSDIEKAGGAIEDTAQETEDNMTK